MHLPSLFRTGSDSRCGVARFRINYNQLREIRMVTDCVLVLLSAGKKERSVKMKMGGWERNGLEPPCFWRATSPQF